MKASELVAASAAGYEHHHDRTNPAPREAIATSACDVLRIPLFSQLAEELDVALTAGVGLGVSASATATAEIGVAYGPDGEFGCYVAGCVGFSTGASLSEYGVLGMYDAFDSVAGDSLVESVEVSVNPFAIFDLPIPIAYSGSAGQVTNMLGQPIGATISASKGLAFPTPIDLSTTALTCHTAVLQSQ